MNPNTGVAVVIPTLGNSKGYERLFQSIVAQSIPAEEVVIVLQGSGERLRQSLKRVPQLRARVITREPGLSAARNAGIRSLRSNWKCVIIPDDDLWLEPTVVEVASHTDWSGSTGVVAGRIRRPSAARDRLRFGEFEEILNRRSIWTSALEGGLCISRRSFEVVGGFDEDLGLGSKGIFQSGEGTDLLLRVMEAGGVVRYNPQMLFYEEPFTLEGQEARARARKYARGTGRVYRMHYNLTERVMFIGRSLAKPLVLALSGQMGEALSASQVLVGRLEGLFRDAI